MTSTCYPLISDYETAAKTTLPGPESKGLDDWILKETWTCTESPDDPSQCPENPGPNRSQYNVLKETGFLAWVNEQGLKCINGVRQNHLGLDAQNNQIAPGEATREPRCVQQCSTVLKTSTPCFECVYQELQKNPKECPLLSGLTGKDAVVDRMGKAVACQACFGRHVGKHQWTCLHPTLPKKFKPLWIVLAGGVLSVIGSAAFALANKKK